MDWGDGNVERNSTKHHYSEKGTYNLRIKGDIICKDLTSRSNYDHRGLFDEFHTYKALQYGTKFNTNLPLFSKCSALTEINPSFFGYRKDLTDIS